MKLAASLFFAGLFLAFGITAGFKSYFFDIGCEGHLKRAADANTVELALAELDVALTYAEQKGLTSGTTAVILPTPAEDLGFWYTNLVASRDELRKLGPEATALVRTNVLMKLRQSLLDKTQSGEKVTAPGDISLFPNQRFYTAWGIGSFLGLVVSLGLFLRARFRADFTPAFPKVSSPLSGFPRSRR